MFETDESKKSGIETLNRNFRTILSYGNGGGITPVGEFIVADIIEDEIPEEYKNPETRFKYSKVLLRKVDDENVQIVIPMEVFLSKFVDLACINADRLGIGSSVSLDIKDVERTAEWKLFLDGSQELFEDAKTLPLEECDADYIINGEVQSTNYSICPVDLGIYMERIRERYDDSSPTKHIAPDKDINKIMKENDLRYRGINDLDEER